MALGLKEICGDIPLTTIQRAVPDVDCYFVFWRDKDRARGNYELDETVATDRQAIVRFIVSGQFDSLDRIFCGNEAMAYFRNLTAEIADDVLKFCIDDQHAIAGHLLDWLQEHIGIHQVNDAIAENPCLDPEHGGT